jgi:hypothetical protein
MASIILTLLTVHGFRATISALASTQSTITTTPRPKYAFIRSKKIVTTATATNDKYTKKVTHGRPEVYRLIEVEREEGLGNGLGKGGNTIDVWRRVEDVCEDKEGLVNERYTMKMPLDRGLRQVVRNLRPSGSGQDREKKSRRNKINGKKNTGSGWIARGSMQRNTAMTDIESEREQREGSNTQCSDLSTDSIRTSTTHVSAHQHRCASVKELLKSPETSKTPVPSTTQFPYATQSQRRRSRPPISGSPFGQPTMSPEQSKNFVFGNRNSSSVESLLKTNNSGSTIRIVPDVGDHAITHRGSKKMSPAV